MQSANILHIHQAILGGSQSIRHLEFRSVEFPPLSGLKFGFVVGVHHVVNVNSYSERITCTF